LPPPRPSTFVPFDALQAETRREQTPLRAAITAAYRRDETVGRRMAAGPGRLRLADAYMLAHRLVSACAKSAPAPRAWMR
jgi:RHH-type proline utilization regulon transcriptional repressor/proline dehydrogenase/delta 1-pyrroline-5-carboxylate dehydrogenase